MCAHGLIQKIVFCTFLMMNAREGPSNQLRRFVMAKPMLMASLILAGSLSSVAASAQDASAPGLTPPPADGSGAPGATPPPAAAPAATPAPAAAAEKEEEGRFRVGFTINGGVGSGADISGPAVGATLRLGWQIDRLFGVYYQPTVAAWFGSSDKCGGASCDLGAIAAFDNSVLGSISPVDMLEIAAGPSADLLSGGKAGGSVGAGTASASAKAFSGAYFGLHGRIGLTLGSRKPETGRRAGFTISGDIHPTFAEGETVILYTLGLGADWR